MFDVRIYGDPVLRKTALPVKTFDESLRHFVAEMIETMHEKDGVGLAAPQVGESIRLVVIDATGGEEVPLVFVNPEIYEVSEEKGDYEEGCLSVPGVNLELNRPLSVSVRAQNERGEPFVIEHADGLLARALQHEIDHLNGIMIVDHISALQKKMLGTKLKKLAKTNREKSQAA